MQPCSSLKYDSLQIAYSQLKTVVGDGCGGRGTRARESGRYLRQIQSLYNPRSTLYPRLALALVGNICIRTRLILSQHAGVLDLGMVLYSNE